MDKKISDYFKKIGKKGGLVKSEAKARASRANGRLRQKIMTENLDTVGIPLEEDMSSYREEDTGLPMIVVILARTGAKHGPRVKFQQDYSDSLHKDNLTSLSINNHPEVTAGKWKLTPKDFKLASQFILKNKKALMGYWDYKLLTKDLEAKLVKV